MTRIIVMGIIMAFAVGFVGCRSCLAPWDHCQPTFLPERGDQCMGELYRCGSNLGGMQQHSNANGYCENCGGGSVEYYSEDGSQISSAQVGEPQQVAVATNLQTAQQAAPYAQEVNQSGLQSASYETQDFSLNNDYEAY